MDSSDSTNDTSSNWNLTQNSPSSSAQEDNFTVDNEILAKIEDATRKYADKVEFVKVKDLLQATRVN